MNSTAKKINTQAGFSSAKEKKNSTKSSSAHQKARGFGVNKECYLLGLAPVHSFPQESSGQIINQRPDSDLNIILILTIELIFEKET